mgnify:CR=1 FL=1
MSGGHDILSADFIPTLICHPANRITLEGHSKIPQNPRRLSSAETETDMQESKIFRAPSVFLYIVFILVGIMMLGGAVMLGYNSYCFRQGAQKVTATVSDIRETIDSDGNTHYMVYITYEYQDEIYRDVPLDYHRGTSRIGDKVSVWCSREDPRNIQSGSGMVTACACLGISGIIFLALGTVPSIIAKRMKGNKAFIIKSPFDRWLQK